MTLISDTYFNDLLFVFNNRNIIYFDNAGYQTYTDGYTLQDDEDDELVYL